MRSRATCTSLLRVALDCAHTCTAHTPRRSCALRPCKLTFLIASRRTRNPEHIVAIEEQLTVDRAGFVATPHFRDEHREHVACLRVVANVSLSATGPLRRLGFHA